MTEGKELTTAKAQATKATTAANELVISDEAGLTFAADLLAKIKTVQAFVKEQSDKIMVPLREARAKALEAMRAEEERWEPLSNDLTAAERIVKNKGLEYKKKKDAEAETERLRILKAQDTGEIKKETTVQKKLEAIEHVATTVTGSKGGGMQFKKVPKLFITDKSLIPLEYMYVDEPAVKAAIKAGQVVPGAEIRLVDEAAGFGR